MTLEIPDHMQHLPRTKAGIPVPHVAAWSSERWAVARMEPMLQKRWALFSEGRQGRGRPLLSAINEERQRRSVILNRCQVCDGQFDYKDLFVTTMAVHEIEVQGQQAVATYAPPTCVPCLDFSVAVCPAFKNDHRRVPFGKCVPVFQLVDPSAAPMVNAERFDGGDNPAERERLGRIARKHGGLVGFIKLAMPAAAFEAAA